MTMAQYESIKRGWIDAEEINIIDQRLRREAEIEEDGFGLCSTARLDMHR